MPTNAYELLALSMRYVFTLLLFLIVLRAARGAITDSRRATALRRLSPMTGISGDLLLLDTLPRARQGMRYPVIREGAIGSARRCDIRIRDASIRKRHALFQLTESGLRIRAHAAAKLHDSQQNPTRELNLVDGDSFYLGNAHLMLVLSMSDQPRKPVRASYIPDDDPDDDDDFFDVASDPISPIFDSPTPPPRRPRAHRSEPSRRASGSDPVSPIFNSDHNMPGGEARRSNRRVFMDDDDIFETNDKL